MDSTIWATWYDLPEDQEQEYLSWLHSDYLPRLQSRPGYLWAANYRNVGGGSRMDRLHELLARSDKSYTASGSQYVTLVGAANIMTLMDSSALDLEAAESGLAAEMLALRIGKQCFIFSEISRVNGPEIFTRMPGITPAPAIQMGALRARAVEDEHGMAKWYAQYRLPAIARMPGVVSARTFACVCGWPKYGVLYEFESIQQRLNYFEPHETQALNDEEGIGRLPGYTVHVPGSPVIAERIWPLTNGS